MHVREERDTLIKVLVTQAAKFSNKKPIILFVANDDQNIINAVKEGVLKAGKARFHKLETDDDALLVSKSVTNAIRGVFFLKERYARGFDLKMASDAICMIYAGDFHYRGS